MLYKFFYLFEYCVYPVCTVYTGSQRENEI